MSSPCSTHSTTETSFSNARNFHLPENRNDSPPLGVWIAVFVWIGAMAICLAVFNPPDMLADICRSGVGGQK